MWKKVSLLIKSAGTIILCTTALTLALANTHFASTQEIKSSAGAPPANIISKPTHVFSFQIAGSSNTEIKATANANSWIQNLPAAWHSYLMPVPQNPIDQP